MFVNSSPQQHSTDNNDLAGNIPSQLGELTGLTILYLSNNFLTGSIPSEIGELTGLSQLLLGKYLILQGSNGAVEAFSSCFMD